MTLHHHWHRRPGRSLSQTEPSPLPPKTPAPARHRPTARGLAIAPEHRAPTTPRTKISTWKCLSLTGERKSPQRQADRPAGQMRHKGQLPPHAPAMDHRRENRCPPKARITPPRRSRRRPPRLTRRLLPPPRPHRLLNPAESGRRPLHRHLLPRQAMRSSSQPPMGPRPLCKSDPQSFRAAELAILKPIC